MLKQSKEEKIILIYEWRKLCRDLYIRLKASGIFTEWNVPESRDFRTQSMKILCVSGMRILKRLLLNTLMYLEGKSGQPPAKNYINSLTRKEIRWCLGRTLPLRSEDAPLNILRNNLYPSDWLMWEIPIPIPPIYREN